MTMDFVPFRSRVGARRRPVGQRRPRLRQSPFPLHIDIGLCFCCSQCSQLRSNESATAGEVAEFGLSIFAVQLAGQRLAPSLYMYAPQPAFQLARGPLFEQVSIPVLNVFNGVTNLPEVGSVSPR